MLTFIFLFNFLSICGVIFIPESNKKFIQKFGLITTGFLFFYSFCLLYFFDNFNFFYNFICEWSFNLEFLNIYFRFGLDGISVFFFILTTLLIFLCTLFVLDDILFKYYLLNLLIIELLLLLIFSVSDLFLFYIFFEAILIPMFLLIGIWGSRNRKIWASYLLFFYTLCGSFFFLIAILYIYYITGTSSIAYISHYSFTGIEQYWLWIAFFLSFASKIPIFPLHIWLPEAHVEASTVGSVLLAGILLKLGVYGFFRFNLVFFWQASIFFSPIVYTLCGLGIIYTSFAAIRQTDLKRIIAYSSVAHMNLITLGIFCFNSCGLEGALLQSLSHGFVASALFFLIGIIYQRYHTRSILYYSGIITIMPIFSSFFLFFILANIALPGTSSFVGEFLILLGIFKQNFLIAIISTLSVVLSGSYSLWLYNRIVFGNIKNIYLKKYCDLTLREILILIPLCFFVLLMGFFPEIFFLFFRSSFLLFWF